LRLRPQFAFVLAACAIARGEGPSRLDSIFQVLQLTNEEAEAGRHFLLRAQVTLFDWNAYYLFVQDGPVGIFSERPAAKIDLKPGDWIEAEGVTGRGGFAPILKIDRIKVVGHGPLPPPARPDIARQAIPEASNVRALTRGRIVRADSRVRFGNTLVTLYQRYADGREITIIVASSAGCGRTALVEADVEVHGILGTQFGGAGNRQSDMMFVPNCDSISVLTQPRADWSVPLSDFRTLLTYRSKTAVNDMVRIRGTVTLRASPDRFFIQKGDRGIMVEPIDQASLLHVGEGVEVLGRVVQDERGTRSIVAARVRSIPIPEPIQISSLTKVYIDAPFADALIRVESEVLASERTPEHLLLSMRVWNQDITVELPSDAPDEVPQVQDRVSVVGVARLHPETEDRRFEIHLATRSWDDLRIVKKRPLTDRIPWGRVSLAATGAVLAALSWILTLRNRVNARTRQLQEARMEAERASRAKGEFLANMSHEIRTPMNGILAATELALQTDLSAHQKDLIDTARSSTEVLLTVINDILDFSKIEAGKLTLDPTPFVIRPMIEAIVKAQQLAAQKKGLRLYCRIQTVVPERIVADRTRLTQIVNNLMGNAVKFTLSGEVEVQVNLEGCTSAGANLHFSVRDTGIGIPESQREAIFASFAQADASTTRRFGGTGLGLSISSELVKLLGGRLWLESEVDKGSCFHFTLLAPLPAEEAPLEATPDIAVAFVGIRVLLAEDNPVNQKLAVLLLKKLGHSVTAASNGQEAVALYESQTFDLILMDVQMPGMDGFEATAAIREREKSTGARVPIIALTAHAMAGDRDRCLSAGMDGYATKPISTKELQKEIALLTITA